MLIWKSSGLMKTQSCKQTVVILKPNIALSILLFAWLEQTQFYSIINNGFMPWKLWASAVCTSIVHAAPC